MMNFCSGTGVTVALLLCASGAMAQFSLPSCSESLREHDGETIVCNMSHINGLGISDVTEFSDGPALRNFGAAGMSYEFPPGVHGFQTNNGVRPDNLLQSSHGVDFRNPQPANYVAVSSSQKNIGTHVFNVTTFGAFSGMTYGERESFMFADSWAIVGVVGSVNEILIEMNYSYDFSFNQEIYDQFTMGFALGGANVRSYSPLGDFEGLSTFDVASHDLPVTVHKSVAQSIKTNLYEPGVSYWSIVTEYETSYAMNANSSVRGLLSLRIERPVIECLNCGTQLSIEWGDVAEVPEPSRLAILVAGLGLVVCCARTRTHPNAYAMS